jgi:hypothetical protein
MASLTPEEPVHSLGLRKLIVRALTVQVVAAFTVMLLEYKRYISVEELGLPAGYLYLGGLAVILLAVAGRVTVWRCPGCRTYLAWETNPARCPACGARFQ